MDRRTFIGTLAGSVLASPFSALAQQPAKLFRIGVLGNEDTPPWEGLRRGLRELGYIDGGNVVIDWRWSKGSTDRFPPLAAELVQAKVDILVVSGTQAAQAAKDATSTIPIVMTVSAYPDKIGLVQSLARPGGNLTGLTNLGPELMGKHFELIKEIAPKVSRIALLRNPAAPVEQLSFEEMRGAAPASGLEILSIEARRPEDAAAAFAAVTASGADALFAHGNPVNFKIRGLIAEFALKSRLPSLFQERLFVESGGLVSYAPSFFDLFARAAGYVDRILKGAKPADLPVEQPTKFELAINLKTAKALGITVAPSLLLRADKLIQ